MELSYEIYLSAEYRFVLSIFDNTAKFFLNAKRTSISFLVMYRSRKRSRHWKQMSLYDYRTYMAM